MRVAIVMPLAEQKGGAELLLLHLLKANQATDRMQYCVAFLSDGPMVNQVRAFTPKVRIFRAGRLRQLNLYVLTVFRLAQWFRRERIEMVMSWMSMAHLYGSPASVLVGLRNVWWQHGFADRSPIERVTEWLPSSRTLCCSAAVQAAQQKLSARASVVIHPAVDLSVFDPDALPLPVEQRKRLSLPKVTFLIGLFGRLQRWKGMDTFVEAAALLAHERSDVHFLIVGGEHALEPAYAHELSKRVESLGLRKRITMTGFQANPSEWMNACDIVVHASIKAEPFGMVILEAMALGKIVIAAKAGGPLEIMQHGINGYLFNPGDALALAAAMRAGVNGGSINASLQNKARLTASQFSISRFADRVSEHLWQAARA